MICQNEKAQYCEKNEKEEELTYAKETMQNSEVLGGRPKSLGLLRIMIRTTLNLI